MANIDPTVAQVLDHSRGDLSDDEDALIAKLEEDDGAFTSLREKRLEQLHSEINRAKTLKESAHGTYAEIKDEKQLMDLTTSTKLCVVHFMKPDFNRCRIMDEKLKVLAEKHFDTRFVSINVENAPFLVVKLAIVVLPCVIAFIKGVSADRIVGFEGIGYKEDSFKVSELEARLLRSDVLVRAMMTGSDDFKPKKQREASAMDENDDDWD